MGEKAEEHSLYSGAFLIGFFSAPFLTCFLGLAAAFTMANFEIGLGAFELLVAAATMSVFVGAPSYLLFGLPILWFAAVHKRPSPFFLCKRAMIANVIAVPFVSAFWFFVISGGSSEDFLSLAFYLAAFGTFFAAVWGAWVGFIYGPLTRTADRLSARASVHHRQHPGLK